MASKMISVGIVSEGATDQFVLGVVLKDISSLNGIDFEIRPIQPKYDAINDSWSQGGWGLIYCWCKHVVKAYGSVDGYLKCNQIDILVLQLDADVMYRSYSSCPSVTPEQTDYPLPIPTPCPSGNCSIPCHAVKAIPLLINSWLCSSSLPDNVLLCTPSKSMDAWVIAAMPINIFNRRKDDESKFYAILNNLECVDAPENCFVFSDRIGKSLRSYKRYDLTIANNIKAMLQKCTMAQVFYNSFQKTITKMIAV